MVNWLVGSLVLRLVVWFFGHVSGMSLDWLVICLFGQVVGWSPEWLTDLYLGQLVACYLDWLVGSLVGGINQVDRLGSISTTV